MSIRLGQSEEIVKVGHILRMVSVEVDKIGCTTSHLLHVRLRSQDPSSLASDLFYQLLSLLVRLIEQADKILFRHVGHVVAGIQVSGCKHLPLLHVVEDKEEEPKSTHILVQGYIKTEIVNLHVGKKI